LNGLNVTHVVGFPIDFNGNLRRASSEAIHVSEYGINVSFAVSREGAQRVFKEVKGFSVIPLRPLWSGTAAKQLGWRFNNLIALPLQTFKLALKTNILHVHAPTPVFKPFSIALINKLSKVPLVLDLHDPWSGHPFPVLGSFEAQLRSELMRYAINRADSVVVAHTALTTVVQRISPQKNVSVIPNGVDVRLFRPQARNEIVAEKLRISEQDTVVAFSGHVTNEKGLDVLAKSAPYIIEDHPRVKFLIIGDGLYMKDFKALVSNLHLREKFFFTGFVSGEQLPDYLSLADICVAPYTPGPWYQVSKVETPIKVVEYMAMGKPVVMSRISEENVLAWGNGGLIVTPGDVSELASGIIALIEDEKSRKSFGENGRKFVEKDYSWQKISRKLVDIYKSLNEYN